MAKPSPESLGEDAAHLPDFLTTTIGPLSQITAVETTPLLATAKRPASSAAADEFR